MRRARMISALVVGGCASLFLSGTAWARENPTSLDKADRNRNGVVCFSPVSLGWFDDPCQPGEDPLRLGGQLASANAHTAALGAVGTAFEGLPNLPAVDRAHASAVATVDAVFSAVAEAL